MLTLGAAALATPAEAQEADRELSVIGRLQLDTTVADADFEAGSLSWSDSEVRRARIGVDGREGRIRYRVEATFDEGEALLEDGWIEIDLDGLDLIVGHFKTPVSLNQQTSSRFLDSMERAGFVDAFGFDRRLGVGVSKIGSSYTIKAGVFGENANIDLTPLEQGVAAAARATFNPVMTERRIVHLGASAQHRDAADGELFLYRARPLIHLADRFLSTAAFADSDSFFGVEAAYLDGPFHVAGEAGVLDAEGELAGGAFEGAYVEGGYFLTDGDRRGYRNGVFDRTRPARSFNDGGMGAWEVRARVDWLDLSERNLPGREQTGYTAGVSWYVTDHLRFMAEASYLDIDGGLLGDGSIAAGSARAAIDW